MCCEFSHTAGVDRPCAANPGDSIAGVPGRTDVPGWPEANTIAARSARPLEPRWTPGARLTYSYNNSEYRPSLARVSYSAFHASFDPAAALITFAKFRAASDNPATYT